MHCCFQNYELGFQNLDFALQIFDFSKNLRMHTFYLFTRHEFVGGAWGVARVAAASGTLVDCFLPRSFVERENKQWRKSVKDYDQSKYNYV